MLSTGISELKSEQDIAYLQDAFSLSKTEQQVIHDLPSRFYTRNVI